MKIINLLPPTEQRLLRKNRVFSSLKKFVWASVMTYIVVVLVLVGYRLYLQKNLSSLDNQINEEQQIISKGDNVALQKEITDINKTVSDYNRLVEENPKWSKVLEEFAKLVPDGIYITGFSANGSTGKIDIKGTGLTRDSVLALHTNIAASKIFKNVDLPLDNLQKPTNVQFHYSFFLQDKVLTPTWTAAPVEVQKNTKKDEE